MFHFCKSVVTVSVEGVSFPIKGRYVRALSDGACRGFLKALTSPPAIQTYTEMAKINQMNKITEGNVNIGKVIRPTIPLCPVGKPPRGCIFYCVYTDSLID